MIPNQSPIHPTIAAVKAHRGLVVLGGFTEPDSEYFWLLDVTATEFEKWWLEREEFWWAVNAEEEAILAPIFGGEPSPARDAMILPGTFLRGWPDKYGNGDDVHEFWLSLYESKRHYLCHICCDLDSFVMTPTGRHIYHKGYTG